VRAIAATATAWLLTGIFYVTPTVHERGSVTPDAKTGRVHLTAIKNRSPVYLSQADRYVLGVSFIGPMALFLTAIGLNLHWNARVSNFHRR
jgi:hypothetical protein